MIEATNLLKELADQNSDLGKLSKMDSPSYSENGNKVYDESLAQPEGVDPSDSDSDKAWYEEPNDSKVDYNDDLLNSQKEQDSSANSISEDTETTQDHGSMQNDTGEHASDADDIGKEGGRYQDLKDEGWGWNTNPPTEVHHMPADSSSNLDRCDGPAIVMDYEDHRQTASCGNSREAQEYRAKQKELIEQGKFREAFQMDVDDLREKFGDKYDEAISKAEQYIDQLEKENKI